MGGDQLSVEHWVAVFSAGISFAGLMMVVLQLRNSAKQSESGSLVQILDINRQLISLGFSHPKLFAILQDEPGADPVWEQYYLQLWLNQFSLTHSYLKGSVFRGELMASLERGMSEFMGMKNMRRQWQQAGAFYPASFQEYVNGILEEAEPPEAAQEESGR